GRLVMCSLMARIGLLLVVVVSLIGCAAVTHITSSRQITLETKVESNWERQTQRLTQEGIVTAHARQSWARAECNPPWDQYRARLSVLLEPGKCEGETIWELDETYRVRRDGVYALRLDGIAESSPVSVNTIESELEASIEVRSIKKGHIVGQIHKTIYPKVIMLGGYHKLWLSLSEELGPLMVEIDSDDKYLVNVRLILSARNGSQTGDEPTLVNGEFLMIVDSPDQVKIRKEAVKSLEHKLVAMWTQENMKLAKDPQLLAAAQSLARLFLGEAVRYVDIKTPHDNRFACYEHARIVREWYETRMRLDPNLARWFRMTTVRRNTFLFWQSANLVTPNVNKPPDKWMNDGTGIVLEPKFAGADGFYGRNITAEEFCLWGIRPKLQKEAQAPL
ncbi:MAG: hypothetical protein ACYSR0_01735, partial [Planctomycetota bacterium]